MSEPVSGQTPSRLGFTEALELVKGQWAQVWITKSSLEQRAINLITTSGVLVTLSFGFVTAVTKSHNSSNFTYSEKVVIVIALAFFAASALTALTINIPRTYQTPSLWDVLGVPSGNVESDPLSRLKTALEENNRLNDTKAMRLAGAFLLQLLAIATLAVVVGIVAS